MEVFAVIYNQGLGVSRAVIKTLKFELTPKMGLEKIWFGEQTFNYWPVNFPKARFDSVNWGKYSLVVKRDDQTTALNLALSIFKTYKNRCHPARRLAAARWQLLNFKPRRR